MDVEGKYHLKPYILTEVEGLSTEHSKSSLQNFETIAKYIFDISYKNNSLTDLKAKSFRKLLVDGFDREQIFQQIELQNKSVLAHSYKHLNEPNCNDSNYSGLHGFVMDQNHSDSEDDKIIQNYQKSDFDGKKDEYIFDDDSDSSDDAADDNKFNFLSENEAELKNTTESLTDFEIQDKSVDDNLKTNLNDKIKSAKQKKVTFQKKVKPMYTSVVDDHFFKLSNLEDFLKIEDLKAENKLDEHDDSADDIDYFQDIPSEDEFSDSSYEQNIENEKSTKDIMYADFFDALESDGEDQLPNKATKNDLDSENELLAEDTMHETEEESDNENQESEPDDNENEESQSDDNEIEESELDDKNKESIEKQKFPVDDKSSKTPFELQQEKIKETIINYEECILKKPEWHLTGEVAATSRPKDSLLHQETDFDVNAKPVLVEDAALEEKTENAIKMIIKNKAFSDGQRQVKPTVDLTLKKDIVLDQNKSKKSLAEIYADDYLKKKYGEEEQENPKHVEIKKMMDTLLPSLQALFSHIPKPAIPDIKIVSNLPAITVEEVAPTSISDVTLLAPEEIKKKSGLIKGHSERTDTDKKRERRKKKLLQKQKFKKLQDEVVNEKPNSAKARKLDKLLTLKKIKQHRNTRIAEVDSEKIKSSKDFFSRLQDTVNLRNQPPPTKKRKK